MNISNRIKLSAQCCKYCGKSYKKRENLDKHIVICDLLDKSKKKITEEDEDFVIPNAKHMFQMLLELGKKYNNLEEKMLEMTKWISKKKKKINVIEWLNANLEQKIVFDNLVFNIVVSTEHAIAILDNSFYDVLHNIFSDTLFVMENKPIFAFAQKANLFYIYQNEGWIIASREKLMWFFNKIHMKLIDVFYSYRKVKLAELSGTNKDKFETSCDKAIVKLMTIDFRVENIFSKTKNVLFNGLKTDMKALVEYEFEF
jgi:hypothetical protein